MMRSGHIGGCEMKNIYLYTPEICDGGFCPMDCDRCRKADKALERIEEESARIQELMETEEGV